MENHFQRNDIKLTSEVWGIDYNGQLEKDPAEVVQNKFLKWMLGVNYINTAITMRAGLRQEGFQ